MEKFVISPEVVSRDLQGEQVLLDMATGSYFGLNESGSLIWKLLLEGKSSAEVQDAVVKTFDAPAEEIGRDLTDLLARLAEKKIIRSVTDG